MKQAEPKPIHELRIDSARRFLFGDDVFISYSRRQGADYALALAGKLTREGLSCFLDQWGTRPGRELPTDVRQAIRRSTMLVVVGTEAAGASENVRKEIAEFLPTNRPVIPITFVDKEQPHELQLGSRSEARGSIATASWYPLIEGVALTIESSEAMNTHQPSSNVIDRIVNAEGFTRRNKRLRNVFWSTLGAVVLLIAAGAYVVRNASNRTNDAIQLRIVAQKETQKAQEEKQKASEDAKRAVSLRDRAVKQQLTAEQMQRRSTSERLAAEADSSVAAFPQRGLALAVLAVKTFADHPGDPLVVSAEQALWNALSQNGGIPAGTPSAVTCAEASADGRWLATGGQNEVVLWDLRSGVPPRRRVLPLDPKQDPIDRGSVAQLAISPDSRWLLARLNESFRMWDLLARNPATAPLDFPDADLGSTTVGFTPDSRWIVRVGGLSVTMWNLRSRDPRKTAISLGNFSLMDFLTGMATPPPLEGSKDKPADAVGAKEPKATDADEKNDGDTEGPYGEDVSIPAATRDLRWLVVASRYAPPTLMNIASDDPRKSAVTLEGLQSIIEKVEVSPNGQWVAVVSDDFIKEVPASNVYLWKLDGSAKTSAPLALKGHTRPVTALEFSPDGCWLATGSGDQTAMVWNLSQEDPSAKPTVLGNHVGAVTHLAFSPDGNWLATGGHDVDAGRFRDPRKRNVQLWRVGKWYDTRVKTELGHVADLSFSPDSQWLVTRVKAQTGDGGDEQGRLPTIGQSVNLWNTTNGDAAVLRGHEFPITATSFTADSRWLVTAAADGLRFWRLSGRRNWFGGAETIAVGLGEVSRTSVSADGRWLVTVEKNGEARLWDLQEDAAHMRYAAVGPGDYRELPLVALSHNARWLVTASRSKETSRFNLLLYDLRLCDPASHPITLPGHAGALTALHISHDSRWLVTAGTDGTVRLWDLTARLPARSSSVLPGKPGKTSDIVITPDNRWIAAIDDTSPTARLWRLGARGVEGKPLELRHKKPISSQTASPDGRWLATVSRGDAARLWDLSAANPSLRARVIRHHSEWNYPIVFSPDGRWLVTAREIWGLYGSTYETGIWDASAPDRRVVTIQRGEGSIALFSPDSKWLVTRKVGKSPLYEHNSDAALWDASKLPALGSPALIFPAATIAFSADSRWLISCQLRWDLKSDDIPNSRIDLPVMSVRSRSVVRTAFTPDGRTLLLGFDNLLAFYPLRFDDLLVGATHAMNRNLTPGEWKKTFSREPYRKVMPSIP